MDLAAVAHLLKPPVETDGIERASNIANAVAGDNVEQSDWHQGLLECHKMGWKMMLAFAVCPEITTHRNEQNFGSLSAIIAPFSVMQRIMRLVLLLLIVLLFLIYKTMGYIAPIAWVSGWCCLTMHMSGLYCCIHGSARSQIQESYNIKSYHWCCERLIIPECCEHCSLCQMYSEVEHQKIIRGPTNARIYP